MSLINLNSASYTSGLQSIVNSSNIPTFIWKITLTNTSINNYAPQPKNLNIPFPVGCTVLPTCYQISIGQTTDSITTAIFLTNLTRLLSFGVFLNTTEIIAPITSMYLYVTCYGGSFAQPSASSTYVLVP